MPTRMLRDWTDSAKFDGITADAERLFTRLIMKADDYGRFHAEPRLVRSLCFPLFDTLRTEHIGRWLSELSHRNLIFRYENEHQKLLAIVNFRQRLKRSRAKFSPPDGEPEEWLPVDNEFRELPGTSGNFPPDLDLDLEERERERERASAGACAPARDPAAAGQAPEVAALYPANGNAYEAAAAIARHIESGEDIEFIRECTKLHADRWRALPKASRRFCPGKVAYFAEARWRDNPDEHPWVVADEAPAQRASKPTPEPTARSYDKGVQ